MCKYLQYFHVVLKQMSPGTLLVASDDTKSYAYLLVLSDNIMFWLNKETSNFKPSQHIHLFLTYVRQHTIQYKLDSVNQADSRTKDISLFCILWILQVSHTYQMNLVYVQKNQHFCLFILFKRLSLVNVCLFTFLLQDF